MESFDAADDDVISSSVLASQRQRQSHQPQHTQHEASEQPILNVDAKPFIPQNSALRLIQTQNTRGGTNNQNQMNDTNYPNSTQYVI